ncbi:hypothetical protein CEXT_511931 [Caerostris extrusa]|uniref:Uncharacterized protein n=1 Tax=Caerostris extrusa TaxID=172846 RepID=A0AAV4NMU2_CAEEX|nr:hypothetical protein CEXT_511931 [Caerostris extrusa]
MRRPLFTVASVSVRTGGHPSIQQGVVLNSNRGQWKKDPRTSSSKSANLEVSTDEQITTLRVKIPYCGRLLPVKARKVNFCSHNTGLRIRGWDMFALPLQCETAAYNTVQQ